MISTRVALVVAVCCGVLAIPEPVAADEGRDYVVVAGDSLIGIAAKSGVRLSELLQTNDLRMTSLIVPGQRLELPASSSPSTPVSPPASDPAPSGATHSVRWGDTLSGIASRYGVPLSSLLRANTMSVTSLIMPGMSLTLPAGATAPAAGGGSSGSSDSSGSAAPADPPSAATGIDAVIAYALEQRGKPYRFFTRGPESFDCSGLTLAAYSQIGVRLVHYSAAQARQGREVDFHAEPIRAGDLIFQKRRGSDTINHVGMAVSSTSWIQAAGPGIPVRVSSLPHASTITAVRRYVD